MSQPLPAMGYRSSSPNESCVKKQEERLCRLVTECADRAENLTGRASYGLCWRSIMLRVLRARMTNFTEGLHWACCHFEYLLTDLEHHSHAYNVQLRKEDAQYPVCTACPVERNSPVGEFDELQVCNSSAFSKTRTAWSETLSDKVFSVCTFQALV